MDDYAINVLRENRAGWSLLRAQNAPLAISFFMAAFTVPSQRNLGRQQLIDSLDDITCNGAAANGRHRLGPTSKAPDRGRSSS